MPIKNIHSICVSVGSLAENLSHNLQRRLNPSISGPLGAATLKQLRAEVSAMMDLAHGKTGGEWVWREKRG